MPDIRKKFNGEMLILCKRVTRAVGYPPKKLFAMIRNPDGLVAAKILMKPGGEEKSGFKKLVKIGRCDLSVEFLVLRREFRRLFTRLELAEARRRLREVGLIPKWPSRQL